MNMMKIIICIALGLFAVGNVRAETFLHQLDLIPIRSLSLQHNQTVKTFDTYARDLLLHINANKTRFDAPTPAAVVLDMILNPQKYLDQNIIYIRNKPFREDFKTLSFIDPAEQERILTQGTISLRFWMSPQTQEAMSRLLARSTIKAKAINEINGQAFMLGQLLDYPNFRRSFVQQAFIPAEEARYPNEKPWLSIPDAVQHLVAHPQGHSQQYVSGVNQMSDLVARLQKSWDIQDVPETNRVIKELVRVAEGLNPSAYPSSTKRNFELRYNSLARFTWPGAAIYFSAAVFFLIYFRTELRWTYVVGWVLSVVGLAVHTTSIGIRWWLVEKSVGNWFEAIPIKNQFESVMFAAWFGSVVALVLESGVINSLVKRLTGFEFKKLHGMGLFGCAGSVVGMLALIALFVTPYVTGSDIIGGSIRQNAGILMTYWLYIHVTLVVASYALIGMTLVLGLWYFIQYLVNRDAKVLQTIDAANLTMLQLAFWILGIGIITGALWADVSWGRPWGWDPKETFALITWIVYLIIVHVRFVTSGEKRALVTSILSVIGFGVMMFNWIGVNFFLVGLHSYA